MLEVIEVVPEVIIPAQTPLLYDLAVLINAAYQMKIEPTQQGLIPKRIVKKLRPLLKGKERSSLYDRSDSYADLLYSFLEQNAILDVGTLQAGEDKPALIPGSEIKTWQQTNLVGQTALLLAEWTSRHWGDTVIFASQNRYDNLNYLYDQHKINIRDLLIKYLKKCPVGAWYQIIDLLRNMWDEYPALNVVTRLDHNNPYVYFARPAAKPAKKSRDQTPDEQFRDWLDINSAYVLNMFFSSLHEMGLVELGHNRTAEDTTPLPDSCVFRLTELGEQALRLKEIPVVKPEQKLLIIQPNYEILLLQPDMPTLYSVLPFTQLKQIDQASTLLITQASVFQAIQRGLNFEEDILGVLQKYCMKEIPQNVLYTLQEWQKLYREATISYVSFLEVSDEETAQRLYQNETLRSMGIRHIAPSLLIIPIPLDGHSDLTVLRKILEKEHIVARFLGIPEKFRSERAVYSRYF